ncbi:MAG: MBL fold metallo-hydrolase [Clostridiales Family XIII bacterium]|nr:MBL fold metallo-hydrolase [Clostridiales Family XIII bacterium]
MRLYRIVGGNIEANGYIISLKDGGDAWIIDPGFDRKKYLAYLKEHKLNPLGILLTHHHYDHADEAVWLRRELEIPVYIQREELSYYKGAADKVLEGGEVLMLGDEEIHVLHTPGHTAGGLCFYLPKSKVCFTGDTIFNVDLGYTHFPGGSAERMRDSLKNVVNTWGNDITIYPGHGDPASMKYVRAVNTEFLEMIQ